MFGASISVAVVASEVLKALRTALRREPADFPATGRSRFLWGWEELVAFGGSDEAVVPGGGCGKSGVGMEMSRVT